MRVRVNIHAARHLSPTPRDLGLPSCGGSRYRLQNRTSPASASRHDLTRRLSCSRYDRVTVCQRIAACADDISLAWVHDEDVADVLMSGRALRTYSARGSDMFFEAIAERDDGDLSIMERILPPSGRRPPAHRHSNCSEAYYVLDGQVSVTIDGVDHTLDPRAFALVPRGTRHTFGNTSNEPARLLVIHAPAMDAYFAELHALWHRVEPPSQDEERALMARFGMDSA